MNLILAERMARKLMMEHGLYGWNFKWDRAARRFGQCDYSKATISMSRKLTVQRTEDAVRNTMLHEIAHALTPGDGHGPKWRAKALAIGCNGKRCSDDPVKIEPNWLGVCPSGHKAAERLRRPSAKARPMSCSKCNPRRFDERYIIRWVAA
ncbi:SprT-like protease [Streptomyces phage Wakanda]|uniref:SprT-like protease n=1 Tax=Streptomyces phage Wakanda TaxID=2713267 RepID=A0A6G8R1X1_9CAUD|nr:SprT-like protease [Streptomyces phage Wakanda]QIN94173.1 SprT-like protease [Streptomyces phage Wakanda]